MSATSPLVSISVPSQGDVLFFMKRDDLIDQQIIGNKWRKLSAHSKYISPSDHDAIVTMGGAFSNHILSTSYFAKRIGLKSIGIIRGEELNRHSNEILRQASLNGMELVFVTRADFSALRDNQELTRWVAKGDRSYFIPEGGACSRSVGGVEKLVDELPSTIDYIVCACGTGTTLAGIANGLRRNRRETKIIGICALKPKNMIAATIEKFCAGLPGNITLVDAYAGKHFGHPDVETLKIMKEFEERNQIPLDFNYTGKMMRWIYDQAAEEKFKSGETVVAVHTGGQETAGLRRGEEILAQGG